ncbi:DUF3010 family protein [Photobacterium leiognathi]|uniref:DUF3010 domain-containing protein n=3 Tax=Photobacterium leiognathi TaxID=553611 RepID=V5F8G1_PHOLE|nr:DUF3010 family protein [Photobacterium leiognathi]KJF96839.1 hypothetical protein UB34_16130 [Photobacterium leiognathi]MCG3884071.1 DUF3010 family protein [Photobacterium leiognathi]PHZ60224.1 DUF3010 domain-containing protein [Photobacterium leiognathi]PSV04126.1 DUF3010 domain-containing protein [Photobacterium leiognathi subsp. mandapamensis]PSV11067.1 DUF3010 domain-containing protein [Photobacterium leiognathi subsp. mandapamensis]
MKICAVELRSNEAVICLLSLQNGMFDIPQCRTQKFIMEDSLDNQQMRDFQFAFKKLLDDYKVDKVVIRTRETRGKFAGSAIGFKLESAIQLIPDLDVNFMSNADIKQKLKRNPMGIDFRDTGLRQFQEAAFTTGYAFLSR